MDNSVWGHYIGLGKPLPIMYVDYYIGPSFVMYDWDDYNDFYNDLSKHIIMLNNSADLKMVTHRIIYKRGDLLKVLSSNISIKFSFFKGHRIYTSDELTMISRCNSWTNYDMDRETKNKHLRFYDTEKMDLEFKELQRYVR